MNMEICERKLAKVDLYKKLAEAESQIKNEEMLLDAESVFQHLKEKHVKE
ncbi:MAG: hypothetical protein KZY61_13425 [Clostridiaceae bacterium]|nr:hypothetical protein [Clostridiaceae bacterium]MBW4859055.1 hypothetical protein [Clostridiaceae bacterium]MBW4869630.1 hypothetical protein [Clostridiaceae bacterium]